MNVANGKYKINSKNINISSSISNFLPSKINKNINKNNQFSKQNVNKNLCITAYNNKKYPSINKNKSYDGNTKNNYDNSSPKNDPSYKGKFSQSTIIIEKPLHNSAIEKSILLHNKSKNKKKSNNNISIINNIEIISNKKHPGISKSNINKTQENKSNNSIRSTFNIKDYYFDKNLNYKCTPKSKEITFNINNNNNIIISELRKNLNNSQEINNNEIMQNDYIIGKKRTSSMKNINNKYNDSELMKIIKNKIIKYNNNNSHTSYKDYYPIFSRKKNSPSKYINKFRNDESINKTLFLNENFDVSKNNNKNRSEILINCKKFITIIQSNYRGYMLRNSLNNRSLKFKLNEFIILLKKFAKKFCFNKIKKIRNKIFNCNMINTKTNDNDKDYNLIIKLQNIIEENKKLQEELENLEKYKKNCDILENEKNKLQNDYDGLVKKNEELLKILNDKKIVCDTKEDYILKNGFLKNTQTNKENELKNNINLKNNITNIHLIDNNSQTDYNKDNNLYIINQNISFIIENNKYKKCKYWADNLIIQQNITDISITGIIHQKIKLQNNFEIQNKLINIFIEPKKKLIKKETEDNIKNIEEKTKIQQNPNNFIVDNLTPTNSQQKPKRFSLRGKLKKNASNNNFYIENNVVNINYIHSNQNNENIKEELTNDNISKNEKYKQTLLKNIVNKKIFNNKEIIHKKFLQYLYSIKFNENLHLKPGLKKNRRSFFENKKKSSFFLEDYKDYSTEELLKIKRLKLLRDIFYKKFLEEKSYLHICFRNFFYRGILVKMEQSLSTKNLPIVIKTNRSDRSKNSRRPTKRKNSIKNNNSKINLFSEKESESETSKVLNKPEFRESRIKQNEIYEERINALNKARGLRKLLSRKNKEKSDVLRKYFKKFQEAVLVVTIKRVIRRRSLLNSVNNSVNLKDIEEDFLKKSIEEVESTKGSSVKVLQRLLSDKILAKKAQIENEIKMKKKQEETKELKSKYIKKFFNQVDRKNKIKLKKTFEIFYLKSKILSLASLPTIKKDVRKRNSRKKGKKKTLEMDPDLVKKYIEQKMDGNIKEENEEKPYIPIFS